MGQGSPSDVAANLVEMARLNRWLGGYRALTQHLYGRLAACSVPVTLLDLGTGSADLPLQLSSWAKRHGVDLAAWGLDRSPRNLSIAAGSRTSSHPRLLLADANRLPFGPGSVDFVISSLFMHHFAPGELAALLRSASAVARRSLIMTDLLRSPAAYAAFRLLPPFFFARNYLTRHDGAVSIRRAYRPAELAEIAAAAGLPHARIDVHWPWRMTLVVDR